MSFLRILLEIRTPFLDQFFQFITYFGQEIVIIAVICILYWCVNKHFAYQLMFTYFLAGLAVQTLKITFRIPRPWVLDSRFHPVDSAVSGATGYSFPSGHTQGGTCLFTPCALNTKKIFLRALCGCAIFLIGFSRLYLGVHTPKDVIVSFLISVLLSVLVWKYKDILTVRKEYLKLIAISLGVISLAIALYAYFLLLNDIIELKLATDCIKATGAGFGFAIGYYVERNYIDFRIKSHPFFVQVVKLTSGLVGTLAIKTGITVLLGTSFPIKFLEYFLVVFWIIAIYPAIFTCLEKKK